MPISEDAWGYIRRMTNIPISYDTSAGFFAAVEQDLQRKQDQMPLDPPNRSCCLAGGPEPSGRATWGLYKDPWVNQERVWVCDRRSNWERLYEKIESSGSSFKTEYDHEKNQIVIGFDLRGALNRPDSTYYTAPRDIIEIPLAIVLLDEKIGPSLEMAIKRSDPLYWERKINGKSRDELKKFAGVVPLDNEREAVLEFEETTIVEIEIDGPRELDI